MQFELSKIFVRSLKENWEDCFVGHDLELEIHENWRYQLCIDLIPQERFTCPLGTGWEEIRDIIEKKYELTPHTDPCVTVSSGVNIIGQQDKEGNYVFYSFNRYKRRLKHVEVFVYKLPTTDFLRAFGDNKRFQIRIHQNSSGVSYILFER